MAKAKQQWPADHVERRPIDSLIPYARNSRTHSAEQVAQIAASMKEWGFTNPILVDEGGVIIAGHGRVLAAQKLGLKEVPVMVASGWTEGQKKAYCLADNRIALNSGWDDAMLRAEFEDLQDLGVDLTITGFDREELAALLVDDDGMEPGAPDDGGMPVVASGEVWLLGDHKLICGPSGAELIIKNWEQSTGGKAVLIKGDGYE